MKNKLPLLIIALLLTSILAACNLPVQQPTPDLTQIATFVQQTVAAMPSQTMPVLPTQPATEAPTPTSTNINIIPITPTLEPSLTPTIVPSSTPLPTALPVSPKSALGNPVYVDPIKTGGNFGLENKPYKDEVSEFYVENEVLVMKSRAINNFHSWRLTYPRPRNFYLEAPFNTQSCAGSDAYGLYFFAPDYVIGQGYYFGVTCDGQFYLMNRNKVNVTRMIEPTQTDKLRTGAGQTNVLGVWVKDQTVRLYINDALVAEVPDARIEAEGHFGVFVAGKSGNLVVTMPEISYWNVK